MPAVSPPRPASAARPRKGEPVTRFDRRMGEILEFATDVFYEKGYEGASMRDLSRVSGMSLAGLYYYFESKEKLLYLIQKHTFSTILERLRQRLEGESDPEKQIRIFIGNHLEYFLANQKAMKVLSHEDDVLKNGYGEEIAAIKRDYYHLCLELVDALKHAKDLQFNSRMAVMGLFGMMNWLYTWYNPRVDAGAEDLSHLMGDIFLHGVLTLRQTAENGRRQNGRAQKSLKKPRAASSGT